MASTARYAIKLASDFPESQNHGSHPSESMLGMAWIMHELWATSPNDDVEDRYGLVVYDTEGQWIRHKEKHGH